MARKSVETSVGESIVKVRFAPSPTGIPHIGNTRTALFNYLFARHNKGKFIVRIEDTDRARFVKEAEDAIFDILNWLKFEYDEKHKQSERLPVYKKHAEILKEKNLIYEDNGALRFKMPNIGETGWEDLIGKKKISFKNENQEDFVIIKSDGYPTYNFANVVDDYLMGVTHVIRGDEFISSTPKHIQLYKAFDWKLPQFAHLPVILGPDRSKLSKRHGAKSALDYRREGYLKEALLNYIALLGWNPGKNQEILSSTEMIEKFDLRDVNTASPVFDPIKLEWMNGVYIRQLPKERVEAEILEIHPEFKKIDKKTFDRFLNLAKTRIKTLGEFKNEVLPFLNREETDLSKREKEVSNKLYTEFNKIGKWEEEEILESIRKILKEGNIKMNVIYKIMIGKERGLPLPSVLSFIGKEKTLELLKE